MYKFNGFTIKASNALNYSILIAEQMGHTYVGSEHVLLGILREGTGVGASILKHKGITFQSLSQNVLAQTGQGISSTLSPNDFSHHLKKILEKSPVESRGTGLVVAGTEHILLAITTQPNSFAAKYLTEYNLDRSVTSKMINEIISNGNLDYNKGPLRPPRQNTRCVTLDKFGRDLTELAYNGNLDPVVGRDKEVERVIQILTRRTKNNPCLIGETGVGKTAIVEGLAQRIANGTVPNLLADMRIITVDLTSMVSGTKYRGDFEERIRALMEEVTQNKNIILFIDEIHTIMGVGAAEGAVDAANMMKPQLARGGFQVVGATTIDEYKKTIERDSALERRFQTVMVEEPSDQDTFEILSGLRNKYEHHHNINISDDALHAAITLSQRYDCGRFLPDKAIDLIDEASARLCLNQCNITPTGEKQTLTHHHIAEIISQITGIDMSDISQQETERLFTLDKTLRENIIGQDEAIDKIAKSIRRSRVGLKDPRRPIAGFLFAGPTGVGKTLLCRGLAKALFGKQDAMIKLDMSEYMEKHSISKLIGSPPGYLGYEEGGQLTDKIRRKPYSIVLFDEIEKAHPDIANILLQILEDGTITDARGRSANFKNAIIILTTNVGAELVTGGGTVGFGSDKQLREQLVQRMQQQVKKQFTPELLNRLDDIIVFKQLEKKHLLEIAKLELFQIEEKLSAMSITADIDETLTEAIANTADHKQYGARTLRRKVTTQVADPLADKILKGEIKTGDQLWLSFAENQLDIKITTSLGAN